MGRGDAAFARRSASVVNARSHLTTISGCWRIEPPVEVRGLDADQRQRDLDLGPMLDAVLDRVEQKEALRILVRFSLIRQSDDLVLIEPLGDRDELIAARGCRVAECIETRPRAVDVAGLALVLPALRPQH